MSNNDIKLKTKQVLKLINQAAKNLTKFIWTVTTLQVVKYLARIISETFLLYIQISA